MMMMMMMMMVALFQQRKLIIVKTITNLKGEEIQGDHKRDGKMISERKEQAKGPKPYS